MSSEIKRYFIPSENKRFCIAKDVQKLEDKVKKLEWKLRESEARGSNHICNALKYRLKCGRKDTQLEKLKKELAELKEVNNQLLKDLDSIYDPLCDINFVVRMALNTKEGIEMLKEANSIISEHAKSSEYLGPSNLQYGLDNKIYGAIGYSGGPNNEQ